MSESKHIYIVYKTTNLVNGKFYIGKHKQKFHFPILFDGYFGSGVGINRAIKKYGKENFIRETLHVFYTPEKAYQKEKELVDENFINRTDTYNVIGGGYGASKISSETKQKMSNSHKGIIKSEETRQRLSKAHKGKVMSEEAKQKMRIAKTGVNHPLFGKNHSSETKQKMSDSHNGKVMSEETKQKMSKAKSGENNPMFGKHISEETRNKTRLAKLGKQSKNKGKIKPKIVCPHCGKSGGIPAMRRWHFNNCPQQ